MNGKSDHSDSVGPRYTDKLTGNERIFHPSRHEAVARFDSLDATIMSDLSSSEDVEILGAEPTAKVVIVKANPTLDIQSDSFLTDLLRSNPNVKDVIPVMIDSDELPRYFLPDNFSVQFNESVSPDDVERIVSAQGVEVAISHRTPGYYTLTVPEGQELFSIIRRFTTLDEVHFAEPSEIGLDDAQSFEPNASEFEQLWAMHNTGQVINGTAGTAGADISALEAWEITGGERDVVIVVIDTGADTEHPNLVGNAHPRLEQDWDFSNDAGDEPVDLLGHGSHVVGICAATDSNSIIGVAWNCRFIPLKISLQMGRYESRADAINFVARMAQTNTSYRYVINCSWKMSGDHSGIRLAFRRASESNVLTVVAAGNQTVDTDEVPRYPAVYSDVLAVASLDQNDRKASNSNWGSAISVCAPGVNVYSTFPNGNYGFLSGTSQAAPHVAGLAGLIWSRNKNLTHNEVREIITSSCNEVDSVNPEFAGRLGSGRINAAAALALTPSPV